MPGGVCTEFIHQANQCLHLEHFDGIASRNHGSGRLEIKMPIFLIVSERIVRNIHFCNNGVIALRDIVERRERIIENLHASVELFDDASLLFLINLVCLSNLLPIALHALFFRVEDVDGSAGAAAIPGVVQWGNDG